MKKALKAPHHQPFWTYMSNTTLVLGACRMNMETKHTHSIVIECDALNTYILAALIQHAMITEWPLSYQDEVNLNTNHSLGLEVRAPRKLLPTLQSHIATIILNEDWPQDD